MIVMTIVYYTIIVNEKYKLIWINKYLHENMKYIL